MNSDNDKIRSRAKRALQRYFEKRTSPRFMLSVVIVLTGLVGFGISAVLLKSGLTAMSIRYPLAVLGAYAVFLGLIRLWAEFERRRFDPEDPVILSAFEEEEEPVRPSVEKSDSRWWDWLDVGGDFIPSDEGCLPMLLIGAIVGLLALLVVAVGAAPVLIAEVFIDVVLAGMLYRRLKLAQAEHWLSAAIQKTWIYVFSAAALLALAGWCLDTLALDSDTMGNAVRELWPK